MDPLIQRAHQIRLRDDADEMFFVVDDRYVVVTTL